MRKQLRVISELNKLAYSSMIVDSTHGTIKLTDNEVLFDSNGVIRILDIFFKGVIDVENKLPNGYHINIKEQKIRIVNMLGHSLNKNGLLFHFNGNMEILRCNAKTFQGNQFFADISDTNISNFINSSETNVEDDSLLLLESQEKIYQSLFRNNIDDDTIRGLYSNKTLPNGYSGYYNYSPKNKLYTTKKGTPILNPNSKTNRGKIKEAQKKISSIPIKHEQTKAVFEDKSLKKDLESRDSNIITLDKKIKKIKKGK